MFGKFHHVDWSNYACQYDLMAAINPAYQELLRHCVETVRAWPLQVGDVLADFGAGTGNFSIKLDLVLPHVSILHIDSNEAMLKRAVRKAEALGLANWRVHRLDMNAEAYALPELAGAVSIHNLFALNDPRAVISRICAALRYGGYLYACDIGRDTNILDWSRYLIGESLRARGIWETCLLLIRCGTIRKENRRISRARRNGSYWRHTLPEFCAVFEQAGLNVQYASDKFNRGCDDLVIARKESGF